MTELTGYLLAPGWNHYDGTIIGTIFKKVP